MTTSQLDISPVPPGVSINAKQRLFVLNSGDGVTCMGFDHCFETAAQLARALSVQGPSESQRGTIACYQQYLSLVGQYGKSPVSKRTWYPDGTPPKVRSVIEAARASYTDYHAQGTVLRLFYGDPETGRDWAEQNDVIGFIGRSSGMMKVPLVLEPLLDEERNIVSSGFGGSIMTRSIVRIINVTSGEEMYRHKNYLLPDLQIEERDCPDGYRFVVQRVGEGIVATAKTREEAESHVAFLKGYRLVNAYKTVREHNEELQDA
jgi:hypothetical protein